MAQRLYLMPMIGTGAERTDRRRPKYASTFTTPWALWDYGPEPVCLVLSNTTTQVHNALTANPDVRAVAISALDNNLNATAVTSLRNGCEALNVPGDWISTSLTYRQVIRLVAGLFQFLQRWHGMGGGPIFGSGITLETTYAELPQAAQDRLVAVAQSFGYDTSGLTASVPVRTMLRVMGQAWASKPLYIGGVSI